MLGYCMGGTMAAHVRALRPEKIKTLILMAAPWTGQPKRTAVGVVRRALFRRRQAGGRTARPPEWLQASFLLLRPLQSTVEKWIRFYENMDDENYLEDFLRDGNLAERQHPGCG